MENEDYDVWFLSYLILFQTLRAEFADLDADGGDELGVLRPVRIRGVDDSPAPCLCDGQKLPVAPVEFARGKVRESTGLVRRFLNRDANDAVL